MTPEEQFAELFPIAKAAARAVYGGNQDYVDVDDLTQEAMLWLLEHPKRVKHAHLPNGGIYWPRIVSEVCKVLDAYVGRERLEAQGYEPFKNYKYSEGLVELVLPAVFDPSYRPPGLDHSDRVTTNSDPAANDNWSAYVADVRRGVEAVCSKKDRQVLFARAVGGWTWAQFGRTYTASGESCRVRYHAAVDRICVFLSGDTVLEDSPDAGALADALAGAAPVARAQTRTDWNVAGKDRYIEPDL